jgi:hypothetical protein
VRFLVSEWQEHAPNAASEEEATACDLKILIGNQNVCLHADETSGELSDHITMPVYGLAEGLAHNWWSIFGGRDKEYRLIRHRMGYAVPDVRFRFDGISFECSAIQHFYQNPAVRFWGGQTEMMTRQQGEDALANFVEEVMSRLRKKVVHGTSAELRWSRVQASREDPEEVVFCEAAGALGIDPYNSSDHDVAFIAQAGTIFEGEPLIEFLAGISTAGARQPILTWIDQVQQRPRYQSLLPDLGALARQVGHKVPPRPGDRSWALGYRRARATRKALSMKASERVQSVSELTKTLGNKSFRRGPRVDGLRALISTHNENVQVHLRDRPPTQEARVSELFGLARAVGDAICFPATARSVVNRLHEADRQAAGRAFAAEFLAPLEEILSMKDDGADTTTIADELNVSAEVVERQLENQARIEAVCA